MQKKTLRAAPCRPHPAGSTLQAACKKLAPEPPSAGQTYFELGVLQPFYQGLRPKPTLLFLIAEKEGKKASPLGTYKTYFEPGVLQLPTVGQIKRLYNSVQNRFYKQVQKGAFNGKRQKQTATTKDNNTEENDTLFYVVRASTRVSVGSMIFQI
ncbi:hypothetical protein [Candidatus Avelusimicrobium faecicola]|uniref:hypothetical protein n=1 Tax=Candidatus Avelusimicrobium faecicola TaxID=3416205 RepID=UPI003C8CAE47|nr:hypothetical protein [Spirochaetota bacterium]